MNAWLVATVLLLPPLAVPVAAALRGVAVMTFAFNQSSFSDVALCVTFLSVPGTFLFAMFMERWL